MRRFVVFRPNPPDEYKIGGLTNQGLEPDFEGVVFSDGTVAVRWRTEFCSTSIWPDFDTMWAVHGHDEYRTQLRYLDYHTADEAYHLATQADE